VFTNSHSISRAARLSTHQFTTPQPAQSAALERSLILLAVGRRLDGARRIPINEFCCVAPLESKRAIKLNLDSLRRRKLIPADLEVVA